jgi:FecR protein
MHSPSRLTTWKSFFQVFALLIALSASTAFAQVATVAELTGTATATAGTTPGAPAAAARALRKGDSVNQGDTVATGANSSLVLRFEDDQIAALTANARLTIAAYTYNKAEPAKSNVLLSLAQGGLRAVTGLIGKAKPSNVSYRAGNATIGVRGTDLEIGVAGEDFFVLANSGEAEVEAEVESMEDEKTAAISLSGNPFGMLLPISADSLPITGTLIAQNRDIRDRRNFNRSGRLKSKMLVTVENGFVVVSGIGQTGSKRSIERRLASSPSFQALKSQLSDSAFSSLISRVVTAVIAEREANRDRGTLTRGDRTSIDVQIPPSTGAGGGGSTLPNCSQVVSPIRGTNCQ